MTATRGTCAVGVGAEPGTGAKSEFGTGGGGMLFGTDDVAIPVLPSDAGLSIYRLSIWKPPSESRVLTSLDSVTRRDYPECIVISSAVSPVTRAAGLKLSLNLRRCQLELD